jgi:hypothetical protein
MAAGWPQRDDVKAFLRLSLDDTTDDGVVDQQLAGATAWVTSRVDPHWVDPADPSFLPDALFTVTVLEAGRLYRRRDSVDGTIGWGDSGIVRVGPKDPDVETMITPYLAVVIA